MTLPICSKIPDWQLEQLFTKYADNKENILEIIALDNPWLYNLCIIASNYEQEEFSSSYLTGAAIIYSLLFDAAKPNPLPRVTEATVGSTIASFNGDKGNRNTEVYTRLFNSDKTLGGCLAYVLESDRFTEREKDGIAKAFAQFYDLLYRQAEADEMRGWFDE